MAQKAPAMSPSDAPVEPVLDRATGKRRAEVDEIVTLMRNLTGHDPIVWAGRIIGFGEMTYQTEGGRSGIAPLLAFAPGPSNHTFYLTAGFADRWPELLDRLGKHRASKACLYLTSLAAIDRSALTKLLSNTLAEARAADVATKNLSPANG
ncbi:DUF1801 domain-containing protein [Leucobacter chinensis]|uniref:DUF1801 domain-containing protein n=1 Tax=Leucobacter chinensis TaxID=2851010 RepID=UPI001C21CFBF|nr:DUF1801 domain-containing protein [Leucobacter chinensis]